MKKLFTILSISALATVLCISCKSTKQAATREYEKTEQTQEISLPFEGKEYQSDRTTFRAKNQGKSPDMATAKKIAMTNALTELATRIQNTIKATTDQYTNQRNVSDAVNFEKKFEELTRVVVNQVTQNVDITGEKCFKSNDGQYTYWIVIETPRDQVYDGITSRVSKDEQLKLEFDKYQYEKIFDAEMEKFEKGK